MSALLQRRESAQRLLKFASYRPLQEVRVTSKGHGSWMVRDGLGREYFRFSGRGAFTFKAGGALGRHELSKINSDGSVETHASFSVDCKTELTEQSGTFARLLQDAHWTMASWNEGYSHVRFGSRIYNFYHFCLRDNTHVVKGMKWFNPSMKDAVDLNAEAQRRDGMIWDTVKKPEKFDSYWDMVFGPKGFQVQIGEPPVLLHRTPVEADLEYLFVLALHQAWQATGDDAWMISRLENAIRAIRFATTSPYYWSRKRRLIKRAYTIDTWDYQFHEDAKLTGHGMLTDAKKTPFSIMHGDNTGLAAACQCLSEMLERAGRAKEAGRYAALGREILKRLSKISWNGGFFRHQTPEGPPVTRDVGVDESTQVSLSNTYALNRGISHAQAVAILRTYQRIEREMPADSPAEWFMIYPPFQRGFDAPGEYMNGGVSTIAAGELAHGAFEHGFEAYGADILRRVETLGRVHDGYLHCVLRGNKARPPQRTFEKVDLRPQAHVDFRGAGAPGVAGWSGEGKNDLSAMPTGALRFHDIPFDVIDPAKNGRRACLGISQRDGYRREIIVPVARSTASIYLLHTASGSVNPVGTVEFRYADGSTAVAPIDGARVAGWWTPGDFDKDPSWWPQQDRLRPAARIAWRGRNAVCPNIGVYVCGVDNPHPEREIKDLRFQSWPTGALWFVLGITLSSAKTWFDPGDVSFGIPDDWGAAAVTYALIEGLAGAKDTGIAFSRAQLSPRWEAAGVNAARATFKYEASGGYVSYVYQKSSGGILLEFTGTADATRLEILLPVGAKPTALILNGATMPIRIRRVEKSRYVCLDVAGAGVHRAQLKLTRSRQK